ncbi:Ankyrin domain protein [Lasiodiplodia theobromae]|uniref:Ankyrin domain protein n=1 Tax=Lasiodiplodia theobromae TaxID=45133 RepID=UPI0015C3A8D9|nr:Ankyrin domain protein [Lasiodiplodia theobromae]KAF4544367.1 Ankyrin domain protein [Lasiodiplodia theobromae]
MEHFSPHDLWEEAKQQLRRDLGEEEWKTFTMQSGQGGNITISKTMQSLKAARDQATAKYATHKVMTSGGTELFQYNIGRILTRLDMMCQMVDSTMSYAPEMASVVWTGFRMIFSCFLIHKEACEFLSNAVDRISYAMFICEVCAKRYLAKASGGNLVAGIVKRIPGVYAVVLQFSYQTKKLVSANPVKCLMDLMFGKLKELQSYVTTATAKLDELEKCVDVGFKETVEKFVEDMGKDVRMVADLIPGMAQGIKNLEEIGHRIEEGMNALAANQGKSQEEIYRKTLVKEHEDALKWLKPGTWLLDFSQLEAQHRNNLASIFPGSCDWVFDQESYKAWVGKENRRIMWLLGEAGFGKSFISSAVIDAIKSTNRQKSFKRSQPHVVYFFCRSGSDASQKSERILLHLVMQLFNHANPEIPLEKSKAVSNQVQQKATEKCIKIVNAAKQRLETSDGPKIDRTARGLGISGMQKVFDDLTQVLERDVVIVLDGLDECSDWSERNLLNALMDLTEGNDGIHLMITSRPQPSIVDAFSAKPAHTFSRIEVDRERTGPGIASYIDEELKSVKHLNEAQRHKARDVIMKKSEGSFWYATSTVETLKSPTSAAAFNKMMQNLPVGVYNMYRKKVQTLDSEYRDSLLIALRWLVCGEGSISAEPIVDEIQKTYCVDNLENDEHDCKSNPGDEANQEQGEDSQQNSTEEADGSFYPVIINSLSQRAREFLKLDSHDKIAMAHSSVRDWIIRDAQEVKTHLCPGCKDRQRKESMFEAAPKWGHLIMARHIMRTLNNREFQKKYGLLDDGNGQSQPQEFVDISKGAQDDTPKVGRTETAERPAQASANDENCNQSQTEVRAGEEVGTNVERKEDNVEKSQSTETHDFAKVNHSTVEEGSSEFKDTQKLQIANTSLAPGNVADTATASSEEGPMHDDATDAGTEGGGEYQYGTNEDSTSHLRYEITHWHYHVREAEAAWPEEERQMHPEAAEMFDELYEQLDAFMKERALPFARWQQLVWPDFFPDESQDKQLLVNPPVHIAARFDLVGMLQRYIRDGTTDIHRINFYGSMPLHIASLGVDTYVGSHGVLSLLLEQPDPPLNHQNKLGNTPLLLSVMIREVPESCAEMLLAAGGRPEIRDKDGNTALHWAADRSSLRLCQMLLEGHGDVVDVNAQNNMGDTPLHWLLDWYNSSYEVAEYFLDHGAYVRAENNESQQPLFKACGTSNTSIARLLITRGADVDDPETVFGWTALHAAVAVKNLDLVKLLVEEGGARILVRDQKLRTPIALAAELGNDAILEFLLKSQKERAVAERETTKPNEEAKGFADANAEKEMKDGMCGGDGMDFLMERDINNQTPLHRAAAKGLEGCVKLLLEYSSDAKLLCAQRNRHGATPLHSAAHRGHAQTFKLIADASDASILSALNNDGRTPLAHAVEGWKAFYDYGNSSWGEIITILWQDSPPLPEGDRLDLLFRAIDKGAEDLCRLLLDLVHVQDETGCTPLMLAVQGGRQNIIDLLSGGSPSRWSGFDKMSSLDVSEDGLEVFGAASTPLPADGVNPSQRHASARADRPIPPGTNHYYYEVMIVKCGDADPYNHSFSNVVIGFCSKYASLDGLPGWTTCNFPSWAYHGDDGCILDQAYEYVPSDPEYPKYGPKYGQGDVVGAGVDFVKRVMFFTKNGERLDNGWVGDRINGRLFPAIGMFPKGVRVRANFGSAPFKYEWETEEKAKAD